MRTQIVVAPPGRCSVSTTTSAPPHSTEGSAGAGIGRERPCSSSTNATRPDTSATRPAKVSTGSCGRYRSRAEAVSTARRVRAPPVSASSTAGSGSGPPCCASHSATKRADRWPASSAAASCTALATSMFSVRTSRATSTISDEYQTTRPGALLPERGTTVIGSAARPLSRSERSAKSGRRCPPGRSTCAISVDVVCGHARIMGTASDTAFCRFRVHDAREECLSVGIRDQTLCPIGGFPLEGVRRIATWPLQVAS